MFNNRHQLGENVGPKPVWRGGWGGVHVLCRSTQAAALRGSGFQVFTLSHQHQGDEVESKVKQSPEDIKCQDGLLNSMRSCTTGCVFET